MRVTPDKLDVAEAALEAYAEHLMQYGRAALPPRNDLRRVIEALPERSDAMSDPIKDYARAVAEEVMSDCWDAWCSEAGDSRTDVDLDAIIATVPAPVATPKWCNVHQHHKWCEHNGGVMGPTGYAAPDVQAQIDAAVAREREECARVAEWVWDSGNHGAHGGEQANRTAAAIRARSAKRSE